MFVRFLATTAFLAAAANCGGEAFSTAEVGVTDGGTRDGGGHDGPKGDGMGGSAGSAGHPDAGDAGGSGGIGGSGGAGGAGNGGTGGTGGTDAGGGLNSGDCVDDNDCPGSTCVAVTPGGYRVCRVKYPEATSCVPTGGCCTSADCSGETCYPTPIVPSCGGAVMQQTNQCASDRCASDAECGTGAICVPAGTLDRKVRACVPALCHHDSDCTAQKGGICSPVSGGCCGGVMGLYCVYPSGGCRSNADCPDGSCEPDANGVAVCGPPSACPA